MTGRPLPDGRIPVLLSAHEEDLIGQDAAAILDYLGRGTASVTGVAATLLATRRVRRHRALVRAGDRAELAAALAALAGGDEHPLVARSSSTAAPRTAFVFPGQGNQWPSMGADAYRLVPAYRAEADRCAAAFTAAGLPSPLPYLVGTATDQSWSQHHVQGGQFTHAVGLAQVWRSCGILPDITVGHSLGEVAAAYVAGTITLPDAVAVIAARAAVVNLLPGRYGMAALGVGADAAQRFVTETPGWLEISAVNAPSSTVVSGDRDAVAAVVRLAEQRGAFAREIAVDYPGHTSALEPLRPTMTALLPASVFRDAPVEFVGSATGAVVPAGTGFADYWYDNLRDTVRFDRAVAAALRRGAGAFVELSAHPSLTYPLGELADDALILGSARRDQPVTEQLAANIAAAAVADPGHRWADVVGPAPPLPPGFPNAPMRAIHLWATPERLSDDEPIIVAAEAWAPETATLTETHCGVAVVAPDPASQALLRRLWQAVAAHPGCHPAPPAEAEIAVVVAPAVAQPDEIICAAALPNYAAVVGPRCRRVWLLTAGGEQVRPGDPVALPAQAALAAMHRCVGFEFPDQAFGHLDLPSRDVDAATAAACVDVLLGEAAEAALRPGPIRHTRTLRECGPAPQRPLDATALADVVITGGNGTIGLRYARHCVRHGARRVTLLSRTGVHPDTLARLAAGHPVDIHAPVCDLTDGDALRAVAAGHAGDGASLLIHAAGVARFGRHDRLTDADRAAVFGAKVTGLARLVDVWPLRPDVRILVCSSVSGVWGGHGHAAYAAANRMLDVLAARLRADGLDCTAVRWGLWQGTGIATADEITRIERSGLRAMTPDAAVDASLRHHDGDPLIFAADPHRLRVFFASQGDAAPADADRPPTAELVRAALAAALRLADAGAVDLNAALVDLGVDSLLALDLRNRLRRSTGRSVPLARLLGGITGAELIDVLRARPQTGKADILA